jgi:hypothetical protein
MTSSLNQSVTYQWYLTVTVYSSDYTRSATSSVTVTSTPEPLNLIKITTSPTTFNTISTQERVSIAATITIRTPCIVRILGNNLCSI